MNKMSWFANLPEDFATSLLDQQLDWKDLAGLDSALCVRDFRPIFLNRIATGVKANKMKDCKFFDNEELNYGDYLHWVSLRRVPSIVDFDLSLSVPELLVRNPSDDLDWTFDDVTFIQGCAEDEQLLHFTYDLITHCPNLERASFCAHCDVEIARTDDNIIQLYPNRAVINLSLLPLFRACKKLIEVDADIVSFSAEEAAEVPRTLQNISLTGRHVEQDAVKHIVQMLDNLSSLKELNFGIDWLVLPPELYVAVSKSSPTLTEFHNGKGTGYIGVEVMLRSCLHLMHITMFRCLDMTQEAFTLLFELPRLQCLRISGNDAIQGLLPTFTSTSTLKVLCVQNFSAMRAHDAEVKRILEACPLLRAHESSIMGSASREFTSLYPELCTCLMRF